MKQARRKDFAWFGIQARVLTLAVLFTLLTAGIILVTSTLSLSAQLRRSMLQSAEYNLQTVANGIRQDILEVDALPNWCALTYSVRTALFADLPAGTLAHTAYPVISNRYNSMRTALYIQRFLIVTDSGRTIMMGTACNQSKPVTASNADAFPGMGEGEVPVQWDRIVSDPLMQSGPAVGIPVSRVISSGSASARIYLSVCPTLITDALKQLALEDGAWLCWIMGGQFYRLEGGDFIPIGKMERFPQFQAEQETLDGGTLLYTTQIDGGLYDVILCPLGIHDLYLGQVIPRSRMAHPLGLLRGPALASLIAVLIMGLGIALLLHRVVAVPIGALQRQMEAVSRGDFTPNPAIEWNHELGDVGRGINKLSQSVSSLMENRIEDEKQRLDLEYRMLQNQISPHFIYNTLNSIKWMATIQHAPGVAEMVTALSRLLKSVSKGTQKLVPLEDEFALLEDYFTIQRYRYGGTLTLEMPSLEGVDGGKYLIPRFTLQPLAENAIFHGIEPKGGVGRLWAGVERDPDSGDLFLSISDDGVGMEEGQIRQLLDGAGRDGREDEPFRHVGLWSVHRLLQLSFGPDYGLTVRSAPGEGTTVTVRLPEQRNK